MFPEVVLCLEVVGDSEPLSNDDMIPNHHVRIKREPEKELSKSKQRTKD